jgi:hypothetical protein
MTKKKNSPSKKYPETVTYISPPINPLSHGGSGIDSFLPREPDWKHWKRCDSWQLGEAVCLLCRCDPEELESPYHPLKSNMREGVTANELRKVYRIALRAIKSGNLKALP